MRFKSWRSMVPRRVLWLAIHYCILLGFWLILSGRWEAKYLIMGASAAGLVAFLTADLLFAKENIDRIEHPSARFFLTLGWRLLGYLFWLLFNIIKANLQVAYLVLHPKMPIRPALLRFKTGPQNPFGQVLLANSITLTPGTITVDLREDTYLVHALVPEAAQSLVEAKMQNMIAKIFGGSPEAVAEIGWVQESEGPPR